MKTIACLITLLAVALGFARAPVDGITVAIPPSQIGQGTDKTIYTVDITLNYTATGNRTIYCYVFDENTSTWQYAFADPGTNTSVAVTAGQGTVGFYYTIAANSNWGKAIANGTFAMASVEGVLMNGNTTLASDTEWVTYTPPMKKPR